MGIVSTTAPVRLEITGQDSVEKKDRVAYQIKVPDVYGRAAYRRQVKATGARLFMPTEVRQAMRDDVAAAQKAGGFSKDQVKAALKTLDAFEAALSDEDGEGATPPPDDLLKAFVDFEDSVRVLGGAFAGRMADNEYFFEISMIEGARMFVTGWENVDAEFHRVEPQGLSEQALAAIPDDHMRQIDQQLAELMSPSGGTEKNSGSPSPGSSGPTASPTASNSRKKTQRQRKTPGASRK